MKKVFQLLLLMVLPLTASADPVEIDGIWYNLVNKSKTAEVTRNPSIASWTGCYSGDITIPSKVSYESIEYEVSAIGNDAFGYSHDLTAITIPNSVIRIGQEAFEWCTSLNELIIPNSVTSIENGAFENCTSVTSVILSNEITEIAMYLFRGCTNLASIAIPEGVNKIYDMAFYNCVGLETVKLPNTLTTMFMGSFQNCSGIKDIILPGNLTTIDQNAFYNCTNLATINIPNSVTSIGLDAFLRCSKLTIVSIGTGVKTFSARCFSNCSELTDVYCFANGITFMASNVFDGSGIDYATLHVPASAISAYSASAPWSGFGNIVAISSENITIGADGIGTFCGSNPIDFSGTDDIKAYVVSSYESATGQVTLSRVRYVPPFTGVVVKGAQGTYPIPAGVGQPLYPNLLKGVTANTALNKVDGDYTNYVLANKGGNLGFYAVSDGSTLSAGKAYLPLLTADLPTAAREFTLIFDDGETTSVRDVVTRKESPAAYYDLQGRRVENPRSGLYITNGKKVIIK